MRQYNASGPGASRNFLCYLWRLMRASGGWTALAVALTAVACGGGGTGGSGGSPTGPVSRHPVQLVLFYDENGNGTAEPTENAAVPDVEVEIAGQVGRSAKVTGLTMVPDVPDGPHTVSLRNASVPPFYRLSGTAPSVSVPQASAGAVALTLPIGDNRPNRYLGFGDSITDGLGSSEIDGYRGPLQEALQRHFGRGVVEVDGLGGSKSDDGIERLGGLLNRVRPAYTMIMYGTNDWKRCLGEVPCHTIDALRTQIGIAKAVSSLPIIATIPPVNPHDNPPERNEWLTRMNVAVRAMAAEQGVPVADVHAGFLRESGSRLEDLFVDLVHPNDRGYRIIADEFFKAIATRGSGSTSSLRTLFRRP
jgi:lysophospholipase L1-like esterase